MAATKLVDHYKLGNGNTIFIKPIGNVGQWQLVDISPTIGVVALRWNFDSKAEAEAELVATLEADICDSLDF